MEHLSPSTFILSTLLVLGILFCSTSAALASDSTTLRPSFGNPCNKTNRCNSREFLTCLNETCQCLKPEIMTFDNKINSCVTLASESCRYTVFSNSVTEDQKSWTEELKCVTNALCNSEGICTCTSNFYEMSNGSCQTKGTYGTECKLDGHCRVDLHFKCVAGTCNCDPENNTSIYDFKKEVCVGLAGKNCIDQKCVSNAQCERTYQPERYENEHYTSSHYAYECRCNSETEVSTNGLCLVPHQGNCDATYPDSNCQPSLKCKNGKCVCPYENSQYYNATLKGCSTLVGGPCDIQESMTSWKAPCVTHSSCTPLQGDQATECKCDLGFAKNLNNQCGLGFGKSCPSKDLLCGEGFFCINGICLCEDGLQAYDFEFSQCRGLVGSRCTDKPAVFDKFWLTCRQGSECVSKNDYPGDETVCRCKEGFTLDQNSRVCTDKSEFAEFAKLYLTIQSFNAEDIDVKN